MSGICSRLMRSSFIGVVRKAPPSDLVRERAVPVRLASNLEVFCRGLAAIGNLFIFHGLSFVERRKTSLLDRRNMNEHVFATAARLNKSEALGRVEPLNSTLSHHVVSAGSKKRERTASPANR